MVLWRSPHLQAALWIGLVTVLMLVPADPLTDFDSWLPASLDRWKDKIEHVFAFLVMTLLLARSFASREPFQRPVSRAAWATLGVSFLLEAMQAFVPWRWFDVRDLAADVIGVLLSLPLARWWLRRAAASELVD